MELFIVVLKLATAVLSFVTAVALHVRSYGRDARNNNEGRKQ